MSFNIVDLVKDQMTDAVLSKAGGLLGGDASKLAGGLDSVIPGLLGGLTGAANAPGKAGALFDAVNNSDDGVFGDLAGAFGGSNSNGMIEQGSNALSGLMGSGMMGGLGSVLSSVTGMSRGGTGSLMGMLAPVIFGVLKKQVLGSGLDAGGLMSMLNDQKANVANAMPANLRSQLGGIDGFPSFDGIPGVSGIASGAADSVSNAASGAASTAASGVETATSSGGGIGKFIVPILAALGLGWAAFTFLGKKDVDAPDVSGAVTGAADSAADAASGAADSAADAASGAAGAATDAVAGAADAVGDFDVSAVTGNVTGLFDSASETLGGITDIESATAAVPGLEELGGKVSELPALFDSVPEAARGPLQGIVGEGLGSLQPIIEKVQAIPGVGGVIGPVLEPILETLGGLGG